MMTLNEIDTDGRITIRRGSAGDRRALDRLAARDSTALPDDEFLLAEVAGEAWAAIGIRTHVVVADPFRPSGDLAELLRMRTEHSSGGRVPARRRLPFRRAARSAAACS